jgi:LysR family transcriptional regulator, glycine cleavage system transcriptional activator
VRDGFRRIADATARLKPHGVAAVLTLGVHARFELNRLDPGRFRAVNPTIGLCVVKPAGLHELVEGKISALIDRNLGHHPGYRCDRLETGSGVGDYLVCPEGTANCPENETLRAWLRRAGARRRVGSRGRGDRIAVLFAALRSVANGRYCCKSLFALLIKNSPGRRRDFRVKM